MGEPFDEDLFETRLEGLKDTQDTIQQMSTWCLQHRTHHKKIVASWLNVFKRVRVEHRLVLFYLANDVIQYSKRKRYEFVESWATALQRATTMVRDEKVKGKILRIFKIWEQREIYNEEYLGDLSGLLNINPPKKSQPPPESSDDFQNGTLITNVRECVDLSTTTDKSFKKLPKAPICDIEGMKQQLKDKSHSEDVEKEIERYITYIEAFNKNLHAEIKSRKRVLSSLDKAIKFYANQRVEVKVVVSAYKNFGSRIKLVKKKLDEIAPNLPSPIPSPDVNAPSPERDADLQLPDEQSPISMNLFKNNMNGYSSYLDGKLPFDINDFKSDDNAAKASSQPIEVIGSRSDDENYGTGVDYYKPERLSIYGGNNNSAPPSGHNPLPVPAVQSGYTSLARAAQQYSGILPPPNPPMFGSNNHNNGQNSGYTPSLYTGGADDGSYHGSADNNSYNVVGSAPLMPPPPMPPTTLGSDANGGSGGPSPVKVNSADDFNSTWNMNMSWTPLNRLNASSASSYEDTPHSPPHFEREAHNATRGAIEYSECGGVGGVVSAQDVDHRQLHLPPAFALGPKLPLSKDKTRQLDIDHRNLISLTGSPGAEKSFSLNTAGDVDYRTVTTLENLPLPPGTMDPPALPSNSAKKSPQKNSAAAAAEDESAVAGYDPADMVVDMDMSDEDLDEIFREVNEQQAEQQALGHSHAADAAASKAAADSMDATEQLRPALLDTPDEYLPAPTGWDAASGGFEMPPQQQQQQQQQTQQPWNQMAIPWNGSAPAGGAGRGGGRGSLPGVPPPPRPPFPMPFQYNEYGSGNGAPNVDYPVTMGSGSPSAFAGRGGGGRGGRGNWMNGPQGVQYRNFSRPPRGGVGGNGVGSPYFNRGGRGGPTGPGMRGGFRGKFRGTNAWI